MVKMTLLMWLVMFTRLLHASSEATACYSKLELEYICANPSHGSPLNTHSSIPSAGACSGLCSVNANCRSFQYNPNNKECHTNADKLETIITSCSDLIRYGAIQQSACRENWMFESCQNDNDCPIAHSACFNIRCECQYGYAYDYRFDSCFSECTKYGDSFHEVSYYITGLNNFGVNGLSLAQCFELCASQTNFICRFIEYTVSNGECLMSEHTAITASGSVVHENEADWREFDRNCA